MKNNEKVKGKNTRAFIAELEAQNPGMQRGELIRAAVKAKQEDNKKLKDKK